MPRTPEQFVRARREAWERLEDLVGRAQNAQLNALSNDELHELGTLYRRASADFSARPDALQHHARRTGVGAHAQRPGATRARPNLRGARHQLWPATGVVVAVFTGFRRLSGATGAPSRSRRC